MEAMTAHPLDEYLVHGRSIGITMHGVSESTLFELMQDGRLDEIKRETIGTALAEESYLVGKGKVLVEAIEIEIIMFGEKDRS